MAKNQKRHLIPDDLSHDKMQLVAPENPRERKMRNYISTAKLIARSWFDKKLRTEVTLALRNAQSITKKMEHVRAIVENKLTEDSHSARHLNNLGIRMVDCECTPGLGHKAPPKRNSRN